MTDATKPAWQHVQQEAADELVDGEPHDARPLPAVMPVVLVAEGDAGFVEGEQPAVGDGDAVGVAREVGARLVISALCAASTTMRCRCRVLTGLIGS